MKNEALTLEIDSGLKNELERVCKSMGMSISAVFAILARKFVQEHEDIFFSPSNIAYLEKVTSEIDAGAAKLSGHKLTAARKTAL